MKNKLKQNGGFAIIYVIFFLFVLSLMGTAMYLYSVTSLRSVRFLSDRKKAEYLAQAGVESAAYAYQMAVSASGKDASANTLISVSQTEGSTIQSNVVYLIYRNGYKYVKASEIGGYNDNEIIGYYTVTITSAVDLSVANLLEEDASAPSGLTSYPVEIKESQRVIEATGHVGKQGAPGGVGATKKAYLSEPVQAFGKYYMDDGIIDGSVTTRKKTLTYADENGNEQTKQVPIATNSEFNVLGEYKTGSSLYIRISLFNNIPFIGKYIGIDNTYPINMRQQTIPILMAYTTGNMLMNEPQAGKVTFKQNQSNMVSFIGKKNLFVNTEIDVTPSKTCFNIMYLRGDNIVLNGDVEIYVYGYTRSTSSLLGRLFGQGMTDLYNGIAGNYCWSTVVIGTPNMATASEADPVTDAVYSLAPTITAEGVTYQSKGGYGRCGKIFFGGNVFVNIQIPNVGIYRYKAFNAGDTYFYDDNLPQYVGGKEGYGIDLFKYFVDYSIATKRYSDNVLSRFTEVMAMYYSSTNKTPTSYVIGNGDGAITYDAMRKIDRSKYSADTFASLVPPDPTDGSSLTWVLG